MFTLLGIIYAITCILLVIVVMLQSGKSGSMGLFGGGGSSSIGSQGGDIMTRITTVLGVIFFVLALTFAFLVSRDNTVSSVDRANIDARAGFLAPGETSDDIHVVPPDAAQPETGGGDMPGAMLP